MLGKSLMAVVFLGVFGCASQANVDRSYLNHPAMDLRQANDLGEPCPSTGLRKLKKTASGESCTMCAH